MSRLKIQLRQILPSLSEEANRCRDPEVRERLDLIKAIVRSNKSVVKACASVGKSTDWFTTWARRLIRGRCLEALKSLSRKPKRSPHQTPRRIEKRILAMRRAEPYLGPDRISFELKRLFNIVCAASTVHAVLRRHKLISLEKQKRLTKRHIKRYRRSLPGYCQMDVKYVPQLIDGKRHYQFNFVDHCTTWRFTRVHPRLTHECMAEFLKDLEEHCPFPIFEVQTDNGQEFTDKYQGGRLMPSGLHVLDLWCQERGIRHRLIPVGQKELNGKVENTHKQDDREFYSQYLFKSLSQLQYLMTSYNERWNMLRYTKALGRRTPDQALQWACVRVLVWGAMFQERFRSKQKSIVHWDPDLNASVPAPEPKKIKRRTQKSTTTRKRLSAVNRYLQYDDWSRKKPS